MGATHVDTPSLRIATPSIVQPVIANPAAEAEEVEEADSQNSSNSIIDFDPDDTIVSQQTAATELTQSLQSRASQV